MSLYLSLSVSGGVWRVLHRRLCGVVRCECGSLSCGVVVCAVSGSVGVRYYGGRHWKLFVRCCDTLLREQRLIPH